MKKICLLLPDFLHKVLHTQEVLHTFETSKRHTLSPTARPGLLALRNMKASFDNTVSILVKAFLEGTLAKGDCDACAVGNICAAAVGTTVVKTGYIYPWAWANDGAALWGSVFCTVVQGGGQVQTPEKYKGAVKAQIDATGYSWQQLARVEAAFEGAAFGKSESAQFAGLMAVVDVLADIHGVDLTTAEAAKLLFVKA